MTVHNPSGCFSVVTVAPCASNPATTRARSLSGTSFCVCVPVGAIMCSPSFHPDIQIGDCLLSHVSEFCARDELLNRDRAQAVVGHPLEQLLLVLLVDLEDLRTRFSWRPCRHPILLQRPAP